MASIQTRDLDDDVHQLMKQSAARNGRSMDSELKVVLTQLYRPEKNVAGKDTRRLRWQAEAGERLGQMLDRLSQDGFFPGHFRQNVTMADMVRIARQLDVSPGWLLDVLDGRQEITLAFADKLATAFSASADWLLGGEGTPFITEDIDARSLKTFFFPSDTGPCRFELIQIVDGEQDNALMCLRYDTVTKQVTAGEFIRVRLGPEYGGNSQRELTTLVVFLKQHAHMLSLTAYNWETPKPLAYGRITGEHHPVVFRRQGELLPADWLNELYEGFDPHGWLSPDQQKEIRDTPLGSGSRSPEKE